MELLNYDRILETNEAGIESSHLHCFFFFPPFFFLLFLGDSYCTCSVRVLLPKPIFPSDDVHMLKPYLDRISFTWGGGLMKLLLDLWDISPFQVTRVSANFLEGGGIYFTFSFFFFFFKEMHLS